ncbi:MAG: hypothetical protein ACI4MP_06810 [Candidatus Ventricola sp.]
MAKRHVDFDQFLAEREDRTMTVRVFGRECEVPVELPWAYVLKIQGMLRGQLQISGEENMKLLQQMFSEDDFAFITGHPEFRISYVWDLIAYTWLSAAEEKKSDGPVFRTEDDLKVEQTQASSEKK